MQLCSPIIPLLVINEHGEHEFRCLSCRDWIYHDQTKANLPGLGWKHYVRRWRGRRAN